MPPQTRSKSALYDPRRGGRPVCVESTLLGPPALEPPRTNYFTIYFIKQGAGRFWADAACHPFHVDALLFFVPYQHIRFEPAEPAAAEVIQFHANFLCVETFHAEVGCSGVLFNDPYGSPLVALNREAAREAADLIDRIHCEQQHKSLAHGEATLALLKLLLIAATRIKSPDGATCQPHARLPVIAQLGDLIEENYRTLHAPSAYAEMLDLSPKTLGRVVREQLGTTLTDLIQKRILTHAKWQLLHTLRPVKEIARELGYADELYFSRVFKKATGCSPKFFREFETEIRGGSNLSMPSGDAPIQPSAAAADNSD